MLNFGGRVGPQSPTGPFCPVLWPGQLSAHHMEVENPYFAREPSIILGGGMAKKHMCVTISSFSFVIFHPTSLQLNKG